MTMCAAPLSNVTGTCAQTRVPSMVDGGVQINSGLQNGDYIVAAGASQLQPGMKVSMLGEPLTRFE